MTPPLAASLRRTVRRALQLFPPRLRLLSDIAVSSVANTNAQWRQPAFRIRGRLLAEGARGTLVHCGELPQYKTWVANLFADADPPELIGSFSLADIARRRGVLADADAILCPINPLSRLLFPSDRWFIVPKQVEGLIDLRLPIKQLVSQSSAKRDLRVIRKKQFRFEILRDDRSFEEFYHHMLTPSVTTRHKELARISSQEQVQRVFRSGFLLAAYLDDEWVGALLTVPRSDGIVNAALYGWRGGSEQLMKDCVPSALIYETIIRAKDDGFQTLHMGSSAPFVNDGPLNFKLKWGMHLMAPRLVIENSELQGLNAFIAIHYNLASEAARAMLKHAPILEQHHGRLRAIGWESRLRPDFKHLLGRGVSWVDLAERYGTYKMPRETLI